MNNCDVPPQLSCIPHSLTGAISAHPVPDCQHKIAVLHQIFIFPLHTISTVFCLQERFRVAGSNNRKVSFSLFLCPSGGLFFIRNCTLQCKLGAGSFQFQYRFRTDLLCPQGHTRDKVRHVFLQKEPQDFLPDRLFYPQTDRLGFIEALLETLPNQTAGLPSLYLLFLLVPSLMILLYFIQVNNQPLSMMFIFD